MTDTENPMLEILKRLQADISDLKQGQRDLRDRISFVERQLAVMRQDIAQLNHRPDGIENRLDRIDA